MRAVHSDGIARKFDSRAKSARYFARNKNVGVYLFTIGCVFVVGRVYGVQSFISRLFGVPHDVVYYLGFVFCTNSADSTVENDGLLSWFRVYAF